MASNFDQRRISDGWWAAILVVTILVGMSLCWAVFTGMLTRSVPVTLTSDRAGLVMESGAKVKMHGVQVGRVAGIEGGAEPVRLKLELFSDKVDRIPANVGAQIRANTVFGAKYVDLVSPDQPSTQRISSGTVLRSGNVSTEVNTVFQSLVDVLHQIDPPKLNAVLSAVSEGVRGRGETMGQAITATADVLSAVNPRMDTIRQDWHSVEGAADAYGAAAQDILRILDAASTTGTTITSQASDLNSLLLNATGFAQSGIDLIGPNKDNFVHAVNVLEPITDLLMKYNPIYTCTLQGSQWVLDHGGYDAAGGDGRTIMIDDAFILGDDPYRYPDNLPIVAAKGGPGGQPSCGSLPDASKNFPVRELVTNTGWGTGMDIRPNPGIGFPGWANYFPVTRGQPEPPSIRYPGPPAPGPIPYPGAPPYGAPLYGPDGAPLYPPPPGAPPPPEGP